MEKEGEGLDLKTPRIKVQPTDTPTVADYDAFSEGGPTISFWNWKLWRNFAYKERTRFEVAISTINHEMVHHVLCKVIDWDTCNKWDNVFAYWRVWCALERERMLVG